MLIAVLVIVPWFDYGWTEKEESIFQPFQPLRKQPLGKVVPNRIKILLTTLAQPFLKVDISIACSAVIRFSSCTSLIRIDMSPM